MSDFIQYGMIRTLHNLGNRDLTVLLDKMKRYSKRSPTALLLPSLYSDLFSPAMDDILAVLREVQFLDQIVIALDRADVNQFHQARERIAPLPQHVRLVWLDGERVRKMFSVAEHHGLDTGKPGKGRAVWMALGYVLASGRTNQVVLHDCDILTYSREFLAYLCYPLINPRMGFEFVKGYYPRFSDRLNGRVVRLFVIPLINALTTIIGHHPLLEFLRSFRYPLAGEFGMSIHLAKSLRIPYDWGIEMTVLAEIYRTINPRQVCQVDLCDQYDHKHQDLSADDPAGGLMRMAIDIAVSVIRSLATEGVVMSPSFFSTLRITYLRKAQDAVQTYGGVADLNGLEFDRHAEGQAVEAFAAAIHQAADAYINGPLSQPTISNWNRVISAEPTFYEQLLDAVELDNHTPAEL
jgi:glucosyl-3-phosphoglycerate synthase